MKTMGELVCQKNVRAFRETLERRLGKLGAVSFREFRKSPSISFDVDGMFDAFPKEAQERIIGRFDLTLLGCARLLIIEACLNAVGGLKATESGFSHVQEGLSEAKRKIDDSCDPRISGIVEKIMEFLTEAEIKDSE